MEGELTVIVQSRYKYLNCEAECTKALKNGLLATRLLRRYFAIRRPNMDRQLLQARAKLNHILQTKSHGHELAYYRKFIGVALSL